MISQGVKLTIVARRSCYFLFSSLRDNEKLGLVSQTRSLENCFAASQGLRICHGKLPCTTGRLWYVGRSD